MAERFFLAERRGRGGTGNTVPVGRKKINDVWQLEKSFGDEMDQKIACNVDNGLNMSK